MSAQKISIAIQALVADGLAAAAALEQLHHIARKSKAMNMDRAFEGKYNSQRALLQGFASAIQAPPDRPMFMDISVNEIVMALTHACISRDFNSPAYSSFLKKLCAAGDAGVEMAEAFELLKAPGA